MSYRCAQNFVDAHGIYFLFQFLEDCNRGRKMNEIATYLKRSASRLCRVRDELFELKKEAGVERWVLRPEVVEWLETWLEIKEHELQSYRMLAGENVNAPGR
jgi:hypothetical protein